MTINEAILQSLDDMNNPSTYKEVFKHIAEKKYCNFGKAQTPDATISALLGNFIRNGDSRVKRIKQNGTYYYYLTKNEQNIDFDILNGETAVEVVETNETIGKKETLKERDLHKLLSSYLNSIEIQAKTIFHEQSNRKDSSQTWVHPDMVGIQFLKLGKEVSRNLLKSINPADTCKLSSYELKIEIKNDSELKSAFFQAVSNSSWANYGYLVALEFNDNLSEEMARLNQSFGIGIIKLSANPYQSKVLFPATHRNLDFKTIDKLCDINPTFEQFMGLAEKLITAEATLRSIIEKSFDEFCDDYFKSDSEVLEYCEKKNIPIEVDKTE
jgi:hypothetical protein